MRVFETRGLESGSIGSLAKRGVLTFALLALHALLVLRFVVSGNSESIGLDWTGLLTYPRLC